MTGQTALCPCQQSALIQRIMAERLMRMQLDLGRDHLLMAARGGSTNLQEAYRIPNDNLGLVAARASSVAPQSVINLHAQIENELLTHSQRVAVLHYNLALAYAKAAGQSSIGYMRECHSMVLPKGTAAHPVPALGCVGCSIANTSYLGGLSGLNELPDPISWVAPMPK